MAAKILTFTLNGRETDVMVKPLTTLQNLLREDLGYTATKSGCKQGGCGSCTVLLDGDPVPSCLLPVEDVVKDCLQTNRCTRCSRRSWTKMEPNVVSAHQE